MFSFGKKKLNSAGVAEIILRSVGNSSHLRATQLDRLIATRSRLEPLRTRILEEAQWICVASGVIVVDLTVSRVVSESVFDNIIRLYRSSYHGTSGQPISEPKVEEIRKRLDAYWVRFNRRATFDKSATVDAAIADIANESMTYITGSHKRKEVFMDPFDDLRNLQEPTDPPDELELWVAQLVGASLGFFMNHLQEYKIV